MIINAYGSGCRGPRRAALPLVEIVVLAVLAQMLLQLFSLLSDVRWHLIVNVLEQLVNVRLGQHTGLLERLTNLIPRLLSYFIRVTGLD